MNQLLMERLFDFAEDNDLIKIDFGNKKLEIKKKFLEYHFYNRGHHIQIINKADKEIYLIKTDSIDVVTLFKPKFEGLTWYNQGNKKLKVGV